MYGVDTVKLSYRVGSGRGMYGEMAPRFFGEIGTSDTRPDGTGSSCLVTSSGFFSPQHDHGSRGPVRFRVWYHDRVPGAGDGPGRVVAKGVPGAGVYLLWEGSVPKAFRVCGPAQADLVGVLDARLRELFRDVAGCSVVGFGAVRRLDTTHDVHDPHGRIRTAAIGWNPHARSRYVEARYQSDETVWQHNKSRGVRVYDKFAECGEDWARELTRIEYQIGAAWCDKYGIDVSPRLGETVDKVMRPIVEELQERTGYGAAPNQRDGHGV